MKHSDYSKLSTYEEKKTSLEKELNSSSNNSEGVQILKHVLASYDPTEMFLDNVAKKILTGYKPTLSQEEIEKRDSMVQASQEKINKMKEEFAKKHIESEEEAENFLLSALDDL